MLKRIGIATAVTAVLLSCLIAVGAGLCAAMLHVPKKVHAAPPNAGPVELTAKDNVTLRAWWLHPTTRNGNCIIVLHGIADSRAGSVNFAPMFLTQGYAVLVPDSRAHGESGGNFVTYGLLEKYDVIGWTGWMKMTEAFSR